MSIGAALVYLLCLATSAVCAAMLVRSYRKNQTKLLLWSATCFLLLAVNNLLVAMDLFILPDVDLTLARNLSFLAAIATLLYGFIWEID